jgi:cytochrome c peroxidase
MTRTHTSKMSIIFSLLYCLMPIATAVIGQPATSREEPITPVTMAEPIDAGKAILGERLFHDVRLSHDDLVACSSCHRLDQGGDDDLARSVASDGRMLDFNAPTIFNVDLNFRLNWRGNFRSLEEQNEAALLDPSLMNTDWKELLTKLRADPHYTERFAEIYGAAPQRANVLDALAAFQRSLVTPNARFDRYLGGDREAISADEEHGYQLFKDYGCIACHQGVNVGGNLFQKFGVFSDPFASQRLEADLGRFTITGIESDRHVFRVPSLRNVGLTAPYFHDGRTASLEEAVEIMAQNQLGRELGARDVDLIVKFLGTLTGEHRGQSLTGETAPPPK